MASVEMGRAFAETNLNKNENVFAVNRMIILCSAVSFATQKACVPEQAKAVLRSSHYWSLPHLGLQMTKLSRCLQGVGHVRPFSCLDTAQKGAISLPPTHLHAFGETVKFSECLLEVKESRRLKSLRGM
jgi:hypothetical protein